MGLVDSFLGESADPGIVSIETGHASITLEGALENSYSCIAYWCYDRIGILLFYFAIGVLLVISLVSE